MNGPKIYCTTPSHTGEFPWEYLNGFASTLSHFGRERFDPHMVKSSFLPRSRDLMVSRFLKSDADVMLAVDSDIGWCADDVEELIAADKDMVSGVYTKKDGKGAVIASLVEGETWSTERMLRCDSVPGGFFLLKRSAAEKASRHFVDREYVNDDGEVTISLHESFLRNRSYGGEDSAFCRRLRESGGEIWLHPGVVLRHVGSHVFLPNLPQTGSR